MYIHTQSVILVEMKISRYESVIISMITKYQI